MSDDLGVLVLAAGGSSRLGRPKQRVTYQGRTLLARALDTALAANLGPVSVVLGAQADVLRAEIGARPVEVLLNPTWPTGLGGSIAAGVSALAQRDLAGVLLMLCDQPLLTAAHLTALARAWREGGRRIACSGYGGARGVPAVFGRALFSKLAALDGAQGARAVIASEPTRVCEVAWPEGLLDVDTPADLARLDPAGG